MGSINVSVGIFLNKSKVLLGKRPKSKLWNGWWEFPGGKIKSNESPLEALKREINEELEISIIKTQPWITRVHYYDNQAFKLHFFKIFEWKNSPKAIEHDELRWVDVNKPNINPILPANKIIFKALKLPLICAITNMDEFEGDFFQALENKIKTGINLIQIREKSLNKIELENFSKKILDIAKPLNTKVVINSNLQLAKKLQADGIHLNSNQIYEKLDIPKQMLIGCSCHSIKDLKQAERIGSDFAFYSPVKKTLTHPNLKPIGWKKFQKSINQIQIPVYALGGMTIEDIEISMKFGSIGIASQRAIWD